MSETAQPLPAPAPAEPGLGARLRRRGLETVGHRAAAAAGALRGAPGRIGASGGAAFAKLAEVAPDRALALVRAARRLGRRSGTLLAAEAMLAARVEGWDRAAPLFERLAAHPAGTGAGLLRAQPTPPLDLALPDLGRRVDLAPEIAAATVVYTTALGTDPLPRPIFYAVPGLRFLCLTDRDGLDLPGWQAVLLPSGADPVRPGPWCRALPHRALAEAAPEARASLYLAPETWPVGNLHTLLGRWCHAHPLVLWRAEGAADWNDLLERHLVLGRAPNRAAVLAQARDCAARGLLPNRGAWDLGTIWRRHTAEVEALGERWWQEEARHPEGLAAVALAATLLADPTFRPHVPPAALGPAGRNAFTARLPCETSTARLPGETGTARRPGEAPTARLTGEAPTARLTGETPAARLPGETGAAHGAPAVRSGRIPVAVLFAEKHARSASTFLRGEQLAALVAGRHGDRIDMLYTSDPAALDGRIAVLTKGVLEVTPADRIASWRGRAAALVGSWDDKLAEPDKMAALDASMTLSHRQTLDLARRFPDRPAYMVTHHVNAQVRDRVAGRTPPADRARIGYFGFLNNTHRPKSLGRTVEYIGINTGTVEMDWLDALPRYNCHWIVRQMKAKDGAKPFLKGFVAAVCGAVVIVGRDDEDAVEYLGDDYPFFLSSADPAAMEYETAGVAAAFGTPLWARARAIMDQVAARCSDAQVAREFLAMTEDIAR